MRLFTMVGLGMAAVVLASGVISGRVMIQQWDTYHAVQDARAAAKVMRQALEAATLVSKERGPANSVMGSDLPMPPALGEHLAASRRNTDAAVAGVSAALAATPYSRSDAVAAAMGAVTAHLAHARDTIDRLAARPLGARNGPEITAAVNDMIAVIPEFAPGVNAMEATLARSNPMLINFVVVARLATEMRDYAGQLGSVFAAPLSRGRPLTTEERARIERLSGMIEGLNLQIRQTQSKTNGDRVLQNSLAAIDRHFFGAGRALVARTAAAGQGDGQHQISMAAFTDAYVPEMGPIVDLRDAAVQRILDLIDLQYRDARRVLLLNAVAVALALLVVLRVAWLIRRRVSRPLMQVSRTLRAMATGQTGLVVPDSSRQDEIGDVVRAVKAFHTAQDERKRNLMELQKFKAIVESTDDAIISKTLDGVITSWNRGAERIFGYAADEAIGKSMLTLMLVPADRQNEEMELLNHISRGERVENFETVRRCKDGHLIDISATISPIQDEHGRAVGTSKIARDITARKRADAELRDSKLAAESANRAKSIFLANMSHEIRTPLGGVVGTADLLAATPLPPEQADYVQTIRASALALLAVVDDILDLSKLDAGHIEVEAAPFALGQVLDDIALILRPRAMESGIGFTVAVAEGVPAAVLGDATRLRQVLLNLASNAVKFTEDGKVTVRVSSERDGEVAFEIRDTGIGIDARAQDRLFEEFSQADSGIARRYGGTGLGLSICRRLVELMGGTIAVDSRLGHGSTFRVVLPLPATCLPAPAPGPAGPAALPPLDILLAEDNPVNAKVLEAILHRAGHRVTLAGDGRAAVDAAAARPFDAILMDMQMPLMDGLKATRAIRDLPPPFSAVPIIALTANAFRSDRDRCLAAGMDDYLSKPVDKTRLERTLARHVRHRPPPATGPTAVMDASVGAALRDHIGTETVDELYRAYAAGTVAAMATLKAGTASPGHILRLVHDVKSTSAQLGLIGVSRAAAAVEAALTRQEAAQAPLSDMYAEVEAALALLEDGGATAAERDRQPA